MSAFPDADPRNPATVQADPRGIAPRTVTHPDGSTTVINTPVANPQRDVRDQTGHPLNPDGSFAAGHVDPSSAELDSRNLPTPTHLLNHTVPDTFNTATLQRLELPVPPADTKSPGLNAAIAARTSGPSPTTATNPPQN